MNNSTKLSVVIPAYNEGKRILNTLRETSGYLSKQGYNYEIIVIDNASKDSTCKVVTDFSNQSGSKIVPICLEKSVGAKGSAVRYGILKYSKGDFVVFMDADNATPISEIEKFWPHFESGEYQVVIGSRYVGQSNVTKKQPFYRILLSRVGNILTRILVDPTIKDTQLGFKAFTKEAAKQIFSKSTIPGWGFDIEALTIAKKNGYKIKEQGVLWREFGGSHVPLKGYVETLIDLIKIKINSIAGKYD